MAPGQAGPFHRCHQVLRPYRAGALAAGQFEKTHYGSGGCVTAPPRYGLHRPVPTAWPGPRHADRRDIGGARRPRTFGQGALCRLFEFPGVPAARALGRSEAKSLVRFDSVQPRYNLLFRQIERELLPLCADEGVGVIPYNPIAGGMLSGKHNSSAPPPEGSRFTLGPAGEMYQARYWHDQEFSTVEELRKIAERESVSLVTLSVAWVMAHPAVTAPIIGASRPGQLDESLAAAEYVLSGAVKAELDELTRVYRFGDAAR